MKTRLLPFLLFCGLAWSAGAQETPLWLRRNAISPDGKSVAFSYKGDIWVVSSEGGRALQVTSNPAYDTAPLWTPDGKSIVFGSYREGSLDIWRTSAGGGKPVRLTDYPGSEVPKAVRADGSVVFVANIQNDVRYGGFPGEGQVYVVGPDGGLPQLLTSLPLQELSFRADGAVLYEDYKGYEDPLRKHHTSSVTRDVWLWQDGGFRKLSDFPGEDREPVWAPDGRHFYYLSERGGKTLNVFRGSIDDPGEAVQLTFFEKDPVRHLSVAQDGTLSCSQNGELYILREGQPARKLEITVARDENERDIVKGTYTSGITALAVSPNGKEVAVVIRGDVFVTATDYSTTRRITNTASQERGVSFSDDGRTLYYAAERDGHWGIWRTVLNDKKEQLFTYATDFKEELFSDPGETCFQPEVSPDGKWVAYLRDRAELVIKPTKGGKAKSLLKDANYSYNDGDQRFEWSPDSRFLLTGYQGGGRWNNADIALIDIHSGQLTDLTESGYSDGTFRWALGGKAMTWMSDKNGFRSHGSWGAEEDIYIMFFDGPAMTEFLQDREDEEIVKALSGKTEKQLEKQEKKDSLDKENPKKLELLLEGREDRIRRLTGSAGNYGDYFLAKDGRTLYFVGPTESGMALLARDLREGSVKVLARNAIGNIFPSRDGSELYVANNRGIVKVTLNNGQTKQISFAGEFEFKAKAEREYIFEHVWKQAKEKFYDPGLHGVDWDYYHDNYARFLPYIEDDYAFADLLSEMLGELNGSHTGARFRPDPGENIGRLGILIDWNYTGDGLRIAEVLPGGVLNLADSGIKAGDTVTAIEGQELTRGTNWIRLLTGKGGKKLRLTVRTGGKEKDLVVKPATSESDLLYRRWVRQREEMVTRLSGGRIGYVHVEGMDSPSFREVYSRALGKYRDCDALIVDTRHNGGGWLHDDLVTLFGGKLYAEFRPRGQYMAPEPYSKWTKPTCVLVGEDNYSDAHGFPYAYKALGLGKLIGAPVPGTMTLVWWEKQINSQITVGFPQVGTWSVAEGRYLENAQLEPDILIYNDPASLLEGKDPQLEAAVREMLSQTAAK